MMETIIVICSTIDDFRRFVFQMEPGGQGICEGRNIIFHNVNKRYIGVSSEYHLCGIRCDVVTWTPMSTYKNDFNNLSWVARNVCLIKKAFKFGR